MKAAVWTRYGSPDVLEIKEVEKPAPKDDEVLIKVHAATVTAGDCEMRDLHFPFLLKPFIQIYAGVRRPKRITILGQELAGEVESVGQDVTRFKEGDQVFGVTGFSFGAYAEYITLSEDETLTLKPKNMNYEESAAVPVGGLNALHFLKKVDIKSGQNVLINGAGGSIGTIAVQLAKSSGAEVTAVDSTEKLDMLRSIGADHVIDYTQDDFTKSDKKYDVIFDVVGKASLSGCIRSLEQNGTYLLGNPSFSRNLRGKFLSIVSNKKVIDGTASYEVEDLIFLKEIVEDGKIRSIIDRRYQLERIAEAHRYVETGEKIGNVVIKIGMK